VAGSLGAGHFLYLPLPGQPADVTTTSAIDPNRRGPAPAPEIVLSTSRLLFSVFGRLEVALIAKRAIYMIIILYRMI
jgi:hypothetical protein